MSEDDLTNILIFGYIIEVALAVWAYVGIVRLWRAEDGRKSPVWTALVVMTGLAVLGALATLPIALVALLNLPRLPLTGIGVTLVVMAQLSAVIVYRLVFERIRRSRGSVNDKEGDSE